MLLTPENISNVKMEFGFASTLGSEPQHPWAWDNILAWVLPTDSF